MHKYITPTLRIQIELALAKAKNDVALLPDLELAARRMLLSGAEIDAAKNGGSFDAIVNIAVKFALAVHADDEASIDASKNKFAAFGISSIVDELVVLLDDLTLPKAK